MVNKFSKKCSYFSLYAPGANKVKLYIYNELGNSDAVIYDLVNSRGKLWDITINENLINKFYAYKVFPSGKDLNEDDLPLVLDPYATCVCTYTTFNNPRLGKIVENNYLWETGSFVPPKPEELIIYETHIRDITIDNSSGGSFKGSYRGFTDKKTRGGLNYIKQLGVNAVEFLPIMEFGYLELPYKVKQKTITNTWNPYERNHWGYMTANFFSPAAYYSISNKSLPRNRWIGGDGEQITQFKNVIDKLHKNKIAVILDVVYNHLSEYETGNLKEISREYYFRTNNDGFLLSESYCGNDLKTENHYVRKLILDSLIYWIKEFKIDGFRFDLGNIIDDETLKIIVVELKKINPDIILIAEPWGGGYSPTKFSDFGFASWNDRFRNGIKGENPEYGPGWIFGKWYSNNNLEAIKNYITGTTLDGQNGLFNEHYHSVNYLESHDGYTLGDFIRLALKDNQPSERITDLENHTKLTPEQLKLNKFAALLLMVSKGIVMIHSGQEFARSKVIFKDSKTDDENWGRLDHNSYEKDNATNWINYDLAQVNKELINYYKGLINLRKRLPELSTTDKTEYVFYDLTYTNLAFAFMIKTERKDLFIALNADPTLPAHFDLPEGRWKVLANGMQADIKSIDKIQNQLTVPSTSGFILAKEN